MEKKLNKDMESSPEEIKLRYRYVIHAIGSNSNPFPLDAVPTLEEATQHAETRIKKGCTNIMIIDTIAYWLLASISVFAGHF